MHPSLLPRSWGPWGGYLVLLEPHFSHLFLKFVYSWPCRVFVATRRLFSSCGKPGLLSTCGSRVSHCGGFSCCGARALGRAGFSKCGFQALEHRLSSCGSMRNLPGPGIEPVCPALAGGFLTAGPPRKSRPYFPYL